MVQTSMLKCVFSQVRTFSCACTFSRVFSFVNGFLSGFLYLAYSKTHLLAIARACHTEEHILMRLLTWMSNYLRLLI